MTKAYSTLKTTITKTRTIKPRPKRSLTVDYSTNGGQPNPRPQLTIKGFWLEAFGFYAGQAVVVKIERNKLIIELAMQL